MFSYLRKFRFTCISVYILILIKQLGTALFLLNTGSLSNGASDGGGSLTDGVTAYGVSVSPLGDAASGNRSYWAGHTEVPCSDSGNTTTYLGAYYEGTPL